MKKLILLLFVTTLISFSSSAQTYYEDFNNGIPATYRLIDNDGLTPSDVDFTDAWISMERKGADKMAVSTSYYYPTAGTSDDWMILPKITIGTGDYLLWEAKAPDPLYPDGYLVKISTTDSAMTSFTTTLLTVTAEQDSWTGHSVDLSTYAGQSVYIAFINNSYDKYLLDIDNILITSEQYAAKATSVDMDPMIALTSAPFAIKGRVVNQGVASLTTYELNYSVNGGTAYTTTITPTTALGSFGHDDFTHTTNWSPTAIGTYTIAVWIGNLNGSQVNTLTDTLFETIVIAASGVQRIPLYETFTSSTCAPCVPGNAIMEGLFAANPNKWVCIKYQMNYPGSGDPYYTAECSDRGSFYGVTGVPWQFIDGGYDRNTQLVVQADFDAAYAKPGFMTITAGLTIKYDHSLVLDYSITPTGDMPAGYILNVAILEKKTTKNTGSNGETEFFWVMKKMLPDASGTILGAMPANTPITNTLNYTFNGNYRLPADAQNPINHAIEYSVEEFSDLIAVVWVQDTVSKAVMQSAYSSVTVGMTEAERARIITNVYPNPAQDQVNVSLNMTETENVTVNILNTLGQVVVSNNYGKMSGVNTLNMNISNLAEGIYFAKVMIGDKVYTKPLHVTK